MTAQEIKELLDKYRKEIYHVQKEPVDRDDICRSIGFQDCADLLLPLVEALEECKVIKEPTPDETFRRIRDIASQALNTLAQKLGGEG